MARTRFPAGPTTVHYFDGDGMTASFRLDGNGGAKFSHKCAHGSVQERRGKGAPLYDFGARVSAGQWASRY